MEIRLLRCMGCTSTSSWSVKWLEARSEVLTYPSSIRLSRQIDLAPMKAKGIDEVAKPSHEVLGNIVLACISRLSLRETSPDWLIEPVIRHHLNALREDAKVVRTRPYLSNDANSSHSGQAWACHISKKVGRFLEEGLRDWSSLDLHSLHEDCEQFCVCEPQKKKG